MRKLLIMLIPILAWACSNGEKMESTNGKDKNKTAKAEITFTYVSPYCGGAAPSPDMEERRRKGQPWTSESFYMVLEGSEPYIQYQTDESGKVSLELPKGKYCIKQKHKIEVEMIEQFKKDGWEFDEKCLATERARCNFSFDLQSDTIMNFRVYGRCRYEGPINCVNNPGTPPP